MTQIPMLQRLVKLTTMLTAAGSAGWPALELADSLGYSGTPESRRESLARDIRKLRSVGIDIRNTADDGSESRWELRPRDSRVQLEFTPEELTELSRAAVLAGRESLPRVWGGEAPTGRDPLELHIAPPPPELDKLLRAVAARCRLTFSYNGRQRELSPNRVSSDAGGWSVSGFDHTRGAERTYYLRRMSGVGVAQPGTAGSDQRPTRSSTDPLRWEIDEPVTAWLRAPAEFAPDVAALVGATPTEPTPGDPDEAVHLTAVVTNRLVFLARIVELGTRVELLGPPQLRDQFDTDCLSPEGLAEGRR
jgi:proteasome accessory factor B